MTMSNRETRVAVVTGAARGIGAEIGRRLAGDGLKVAVLDLDEGGASAVAEEIRASGGEATAVAADITSQDAVRAAIDCVTAQLGSPTVLVNNAGITRDNMFFKMTGDDWDAVMTVHLKGAFTVTQAVQAYMVQAGYGRIVNISSGSALGSRGQANYAAAKAGLQGLTKTLAIELGKFGVTANCVAPGFVDTEMTAATAARMGISFDEYRAMHAERIPVGRTGVPDDIAQAVSFFVDERSGFVSGQVLYVAGGPMG
jgi:3-oxoacyl-[acyl-carrier protein] reductase